MKRLAHVLVQSLQRWTCPLQLQGPKMYPVAVSAIHALGPFTAFLLQRHSLELLGERFKALGCEGAARDEARQIINSLVN